MSAPTACDRIVSELEARHDFQEDGMDGQAISLTQYRGRNRCALRNSPRLTVADQIKSLRDQRVDERIVRAVEGRLA